jgi:rRNA maturation RNase YbeY
MEKRATNHIGLFFVFLLTAIGLGVGGYLLYKNKDNLELTLPWEKIDYDDEEMEPIIDDKEDNTSGGKLFLPEINPETNAVQLGDVVISLETAVKQAQNYGHSLEREIGFLTVHSMLHLLGYDHETSQLDQRIMREKEESVLEKLGISRDVTFVTTGDKE